MQGPSRIYLDDNGNQILVADGKLYKVWTDFFTYQVPVFTNLAALVGTATNQVVIQADSDFEWCHAAYEFDLAATQTDYSTRRLPNMTILITDSGSGRQLSNAAVPVMSIFGRPEMPYALPVTKVFKANSTINFTAVNFDAAVATGNLRLSLIGYKIFYF